MYQLQDSPALPDRKAMSSAPSTMVTGLFAVLTLASGCSDDSPTEATTPDHALSVVVTGSGRGTVTSQPAGISCRADGGTCTAQFPEGTQVTLTGAPDAGSVFVEWSNACAGGTCTVTMDGARTVGASFSQGLISGDIGPAGGTLASADGDLTLTFPAGALGSTRTITIQTLDPENPGAEFAGVDVRRAYQLGPAGLTFGMPVSVTLRSSQQPLQADSSVQLVPEFLLTAATGGPIELLDNPRLEMAGDSVVVRGELGHFSSLVDFVFNGDVFFSVTNVPDDITVGGMFTAVARIGNNAAGSVKVVGSARYSDRSSAPIQIQTPASGVDLAATGTAFEESFAYVCTAAGLGVYGGELSALVDIPIKNQTIRGETFTTLRKVVLCREPGTRVLTVTQTGGAFEDGTIVSQPAGIACGGAADRACSAAFAEGTEVALTFTAKPGTGSSTSYSGAGTGQDGSRIVTMDQDRQVTATFLYQLFITVNGNGTVKDQPGGQNISCGAGGGTCQASFERNSPVPLEALPGAGSTFTGWSGDCTGTNPVTSVQMIQLRACTATFATPPVLAAPTSWTRLNVMGPLTQARGAVTATSSTGPNAIYAVGPKDALDNDVLVRIGGAMPTGMVLPFVPSATQRVHDVYADPMTGATLVAGDQGLAECNSAGCTMVNLPGFDPATDDLVGVGGNGTLAAAVAITDLGAIEEFWIRAAGGPSWIQMALSTFAPAASSQKRLPVVVTDNNDIYIGNVKDASGFEAGVARYNGTGWSLIGTGFTNVLDIAGTTNSLYFVGHPNGTPSRMLRYDGTSVTTAHTENGAFLNAVCTTPGGPVVAGGAATTGGGRIVNLPGNGAAPEVVATPNPQSACELFPDAFAEAFFGFFFGVESTDRLARREVGFTALGTIASQEIVDEPLPQVQGPLKIDLIAGTAIGNTYYGVGDGGVGLRYVPGSNQTSIAAQDANGAGVTLRGIKATTSMDAFAAGDNGVIVRYGGGGQWIEMPNPAKGSGTTLFGVGGSGSSDVYAGGSQGTLLRFNGAIWTTVNAGLAGTATVLAVWANGPNDVYVGGATSTGAPLLIRFNGTTWAPANIPPLGSDAIAGIWGSGPADVWAITEFGVILHWNGVTWSSDNGQTAQQLPGSATNLFTGISGSGPSDVFITVAGAPGGTRGRILRYDGSAWSLVHDEPDATLQSVAVDPTTGTVVAVGSGGTILKGIR